MSEIRYDETQLNKLYRREAEIPLSPKTRVLYKVGDYADLTLSYAVTGGTANSFRAKYWGPTPPQFVPKNEENISKL